MRRANNKVVDDSLSELREWFGRTIRDVRANNPNGIASFSPRLARQRKPWVRVRKGKQRQRRCGPGQARGRERTGHNRVAVGEVSWPMTQGSSCLATLGFGPQSRWG